MRISDWSSDVCSSDLGDDLHTNDGNARGDAETVITVDDGFAFQPPQPRCQPPSEHRLVRETPDLVHHIQPTVRQSHAALVSVAGAVCVADDERSTTAVRPNRRQAPVSPPDPTQT